MRILVAGGAGFLGSHLCAHLTLLGHQVTCVDNFTTGRYLNVVDLDVTVIEHDIRRRLDVDCDMIFNLACPASPPAYQENPVGTLETCVVGSLNLLRLAAANDARYVFTSTSEVYGDPVVTPQPEEYRGNVNPVGPRACYDEGKRAAETLCYEFARMGVRTTIGRLFNTYGPGMRPDDGRVITNLITQGLTGRPLTVYGTGNQTRSFCYVDDMTEALVALSQADTSGPVNLGNPAEFTILTLARLVCDLLGIPESRIVFRPLPADDPTQRRPDITLASSLLDWTPTVALRQGIMDTIAHYRTVLTPTGGIHA